MVNLKECLTKRNIAKPFLLGLHLKGLYIEFSQKLCFQEKTLA